MASLHLASVTLGRIGHRQPEAPAGGPRLRLGRPCRRLLVAVAEPPVQLELGEGSSSSTVVGLGQADEAAADSAKAKPKPRLAMEKGSIPADLHTSDGLYTGFKVPPGYALQSPREQVAAVALLAGILVFIDSPDLFPAWARLGATCYVLWSAAEWVHHRTFMHARPGTWQDALARGHNRLHLIHHADTLADMRLKPGNDPDALYFHAPTTVCVGLLAGGLLTLLDWGLGLQIPYAMVVGGGMAASVTHGLLWNTIHADSHHEELELTDGLPALREYPGRGTPLVRWLIDNHATHHAVRGVGNFCIVAPLVDHAAGTYYRKKAARDE